MEEEVKGMGVGKDTWNTEMKHNEQKSEFWNVMSLEYDGGRSTRLFCNALSHLKLCEGDNVHQRSVTC